MRTIVVAISIQFVSSAIELKRVLAGSLKISRDIFYDIYLNLLIEFKKLVDTYMLPKLKLKSSNKLYKLNSICS